MYRGKVEIYQAERRRRRVTTPRCYLCTDPILYDNPAVSSFEHRGEQGRICSKCRGIYWNATAQAAAFGKRYRFIEKAEVPRLHEFGIAVISGAGSVVVKHRIFTQIFTTLLLVKERRISRKKEVMWMVDEMTQKLLKLHGRVAAAMKDTFMIRGDDATSSDDMALQKIKDLLEEIDPDVFVRLGRKRKSKRLT